MEIFQKIIKSVYSNDENGCSPLENVLERAGKIKKHGNDGLHDLIRVLLYPSMYQHLFDCIVSDDHKAPEDVSCFEFFPDDKIYNSVDIKELKDENCQVVLGRDIVYTTPWNPESICDIGKIGHTKEFVEDPLNHRVVLYRPLDISFVLNGNHSIMQGIITGTGIIHTSEVYDLSDYLKRYSYNGVNWINNETKDKLFVKNHAFGMAWEVAKMLE